MPMSFMPFLDQNDGTSLWRHAYSDTGTLFAVSFMRTRCIHCLFYSNYNGGFSAYQHHGPDHLLKVSSVKVRPKQKKVFHT